MQQPVNPPLSQLEKLAYGRFSDIAPFPPGKARLCRLRRAKSMQRTSDQLLETAIRRLAPEGLAQSENTRRDIE